MSVISENRSRQSSIALSTMSRMTSANGVNEEQIFTQWRESFFYPLFTEMSRFVRLPRFVYILQLIIMFFQELGTTMWSGSLYINTDENSLIDILYSVVDWRVTRKDNFRDCVVIYIIGFVLFLMINLFFIYISLHYQSKRFFLNSHLYILKLMLYPILSVLLPFYSNLIARAFYEMSEGKMDAVSISFFILSIPIYIVSVFELKYCYQFSTDTPVIDKSLIGSWNDEINFIVIFSISIGSLLSSILDLFPKWIHVAAILGYFAIVCYRVYLLYFFPMHHLFINELYFGMSLMSSINLLFSLAHLFTNAIPDYILFLIALISMIIATAWGKYWFNKRKRKILSFLNFIPTEASDEKPNYEKQCELFDTIVFSSVRDAISYLHVGVAFHAQYIVDFAFLRYLMENYAEPPIVFAVAKVATFFPTELQFLSYCLSIISKYDELTQTENYLLYQIRRIHVVRQSSVSADASSQLQILQKMSKDTISHVRGFWGEIMNAKTDITVASLNFLRKITIKTDSAFLDACDRYPNNVSIMNEYCRFQIEAMGDFSGAISSGKKILLLDQGKYLTVDHAFRALVNVYPNYLLDNILDGHGNFIKKGLLPSSSSSSSSSLASSSSSLSSGSQVEFEERYEELIQQLYNHGKLRLALQNKMKSTRLKSLTFALALSIVQFLLSLLLYIIILIVLPDTNKEALKVIQCCKGISSITLDIEYIGLICSIQDIIRERRFGGVATLKQLLDIADDELNPNPSIFNNPYEAILNTIDEMNHQFELIVRDLVTDMKDYINHLAVFINQSTDYYTSVNDTIEVTLRSCFTFFTYTAENVARLAPTDSNSNELKEKVIEILFNVYPISASLKEFQTAIGNQGQLGINEQKNTILVVSIIIVAVGFSILLILRIFISFRIFRQAKDCSNMLRKTNPNHILESYLPISLKGQKEPICGNNVHTAHEADFLLVVYPFINIIAVIVTGVIVVISAYLFTRGLDISSNVFSWLLNGVERFSTIFGSIITICSKSRSLLEPEYADDIISQNLDLFINSHEYIDMTVMGIDQDFDDFYFTKIRNTSGPTNRLASFTESLALDNKINIIYSSVQMLHMKNLTTSLNDQNFALAVYLIDMYLYNELLDFQEMLCQYAQNHFDKSYSKTTVLCIIGFVFSIVAFLIEQTFIISFNQSVDAIKQLISVLPPTAVATSPLLMQFINGNSKGDRSEVSMTASESIIVATSTPVVLLDRKFVIQAVNKAVSTTTGFTPDQILGQLIHWLIPLPSLNSGDFDQEAVINEKFYQVLEQMLVENDQETPITINSEHIENNDIALVFAEFINHTFAITGANQNNNPNNTQTNANNSSSQGVKDIENASDQIAKEPTTLVVLTTKCLTENGRLIPTKTTMLFLKDHDIKGNDQFLLLLRDLTKETEKMKIIEESKARTDQLLNGMIPKEIYDKSAEFVVDVATIIVIEVSGLTEYVHTLSPEQLMANLKTVYDGFEKIASDFPAVSILKTNSEIFIACCGLFSFFGDVNEQANQSVMFCAMMIEEIEGINEDLDIDLHLRIGINQGGPCIGKMLNNDTPNFEIIGQFIDFANKMQSDGDVGVIQVSESVMKNLDETKYEFENGVVLSGDGEMSEQVYIVKPLYA